MGGHTGGSGSRPVDARCHLAGLGSSSQPSCRQGTAWGCGGGPGGGPPAERCADWQETCGPQLQPGQAGDRVPRGRVRPAVGASSWAINFLIEARNSKHIVHCSWALREALKWPRLQPWERFSLCSDDTTLTGTLARLFHWDGPEFGLPPFP